MITTEIGTSIPEWFRVKWEGRLNLYTGNSGVISSKVHHKMYVWDELQEDIRKWLSEDGYQFRVIMVTVGENGDIVRDIMTPSGGTYERVAQQDNKTYE